MPALNSKVERYFWWGTPAGVPLLLGSDNLKARFFIATAVTELKLKVL